MRTASASLLLTLSAAISCASHVPAVSAPAPKCEPSFPIPSTWRFPGSHYPEIIIEFRPNGAIDFAGGYEFYENPSWSYDAKQELLSIHLPSATVEELTLMANDHQRRSYIDSVDVERKVVSWRLDSCSTYFYFQLFRFDLVLPPFAARRPTRRCT